MGYAGRIGRSAHTPRWISIPSATGPARFTRFGRWQTSLHRRAWHAARATGLLWPTWTTSPLADHRHHFFRARVLFPGLVYDQAHCASADSNPATGGWRFEGANRRARQPAAR